MGSNKILSEMGNQSLFHAKSLWRKAKDNVLKPAGSWTFGVLLEYLKSEITGRLPSAFN